MKEVELYRHHKEAILDHIKKKGIDSVSMFCAASGLPLIVVYTYIAEDMEEHRECCEERIAGLKKFYGIKE